jgi:hypothetical protein
MINIKKYNLSNNVKNFELLFSYMENYIDFKFKFFL